MKILVIRFSSIGDIVLTSPVVRCLKLQLNAELHFLTKSAYADLVFPSPYVDRVHTIHKDVGEIIGDLKAENFDLIVDLHKNLRSWQIRMQLRKKVITFHKANFRKWLMVRWKPHGMKVDHLVIRYLRALKPLGIEYDGQGLDYFLLPPDQGFPNLPSTYICFGIGGTHATKRLPVAKIREICHAISVPVYLLGGPEDKMTGDEIGKDYSHIHNYCGLLSISDSARVIKKATAVITHDTGIMHIAAAFNRRIFSIWGNTVPQFGMFPFYREHDSNRFNIAQVDDLSCRPCSKIGFDSCPHGHFRCMQDQDTAHIADLVNIELSRNLPS